MMMKNSLMKISHFQKKKLSQEELVTNLASLSIDHKRSGVKDKITLDLA
jgi:hypothetical protein